MKALTPDELSRAVADGSITTVVATFPDLYGRLVGKRFAAGAYLSEFFDGWEACDYLLACDIENEPMPGFRNFSWQRGYGNFLVRPDPATLVVPPWTKRTALVLGDVVHSDGAPLEIAPRQVLRRQIARACECGVVVRVASELEFYVFTDSYERAREVGYGNARAANPHIEDYHVLRLSPADSWIDDLAAQLNAIGLGVTAVKGEWGPGQKEVNMAYSEPMAMADRHAVLKHAVKELAGAAGRSVTFMANRAPSGQGVLATSTPLSGIWTAVRSAGTPWHRAGHRRRCAGGSQASLPWRRR
jgi:glutamine synthetase